ncbi:Syntaxin [Trichoplax sp. H2]|nr:Syntaxin [Trichoplax sp. H2]|eukprot:RDD40041.1 Syntaxin [Trichoplax sp. H2]
MRDRLADIRETQLGNNDNDGGVVVDDVLVDVTPGGGGFMDDFFKEIEIIEQDLSAIENDVAHVEKMHTHILTAPKMAEEDKERLESAMNSIKLKANRVRARLKDIEINIERTEEQSAEARIKRTQHAALSHRLVNLMLTYNKIQNDYREKCKDRIKRQLKITGKPTTDEEIEDMLESGNPEIFTQAVITDTKDAKQALEAIEARHNDIMNLEKSIKELHEMFLDMAMLVESQGEMIDNIEHNTVNAVDFICSAKEDVKKAVKYQSAARKKKIICLALALVLIIIIIIILIVQLRDNSGGSSGGGATPNGGSGNSKTTSSPRTTISPINTAR